MRFSAKAPIRPLTRAPRNIPTRLARLPNSGISIANPGIDRSPFSITSLKTIAPPAVKPTITILPTSIIFRLNGMFLLTGSFRKLIALFTDLYPCIRKIHAFLIMPITGPNMAVAIVVTRVLPALSKCPFKFDTKDSIAALTLSMKVLSFLFPSRNQEINLWIISLMREAKRPITAARSALPPIRMASFF